MINYKQELQDLLNRMIEEYKLAKNIVNKSPRDNLIILKSSERYRICAISYKAKGRQLRGIAKNPQHLKELYNKAYYKAVLKILDPNISLLNRIMNDFVNSDETSFRKMLPANIEVVQKRIAELGTSAINPDFTDNLQPQKIALSISVSEIEHWISTPYRANSGYLENLTIRTSGGFFVRSKSECIIYELYKKNNIAVHYDQVFTSINDEYISPDFVFVTNAGKLIYHEHFGLMNNSNYQNSYINKMRKYMAANIIPGVNLLTTFESPQSGLNTQLIEQQILSIIEENS